MKWQYLNNYCIFKYNTLNLEEMFINNIRSRHLRPKILSKFRFSTNSAPIIMGHATAEGTTTFMNTFTLPFCHHFRRSNLYVNPIIHGPPKEFDDLTDDDINAMFAKAVLENHSNCVYIYDHNKLKPWHTTELYEMLSSEMGLPRESMVTIAGLGKNASADSINTRLEEASRLTKMEKLDIAIVEFDEYFIASDQAKELYKCLEMLESITTSGKLQGYGVKLNLPPYKFHTPAPSRVSPLMTFLGELEDEIEINFPHAELMVYTISPSHESPSTYPMLSNNDIVQTDLQEDFESKRSFSRASFDPFVCLPCVRIPSGKSKKETNDMIEESVTLNSKLHENGGDYEKAAILVDDIMPPPIENEMKMVLDSLCPPLKTTPRLQDKAMRIVFSVGIDLIIPDCALSAMMGPLSLKPQDLLSAPETDDVFGTFYIPHGDENNE